MLTKNSTILWLTIFGVAMGSLEAAVVIYLREIYYPDGFSFPLVEIKNSTLSVEIFREAATIIMLFAIGFLAGKTKLQRFAFFIYSFAIWDIFYYVFLKISIDWPESLLTPDILFLIPVPWIGPVIAPIILSLTMIILSLSILRYDACKESVKLNRMDWKLLIAGSLIVIISFILNFVISLEEIIMSSLFTDPIALAIIESNFRPINWLLFSFGEMIIIFQIFRIIRMKRFVSAKPEFH